MAKRLLTGLALGTAGVAASGLIAYRRWASLPEDESTAFGHLTGTHSEVETPDGTRIALTHDGPHHGPTVVLVHGWTEDRRIWSPVVRRLAEAEARVIAYDQRGHGSSTVGEAGYTIEALADDLRAVVESLDLTDVVIAGHSMGGMAAQAFAVRHPEVLEQRVSGLVLVATAAAEIGVTGRRERQAARLMSSAIFQRGIAHPTIGALLVRSTVGHKPVLGHLRGVADMLANTHVDTRTGFLTAMGAMDLTDGLPSVRVPVTVLAGERDQLTPLRAAERIASLIEDAHLEVVPRAGHQLTLEAPDLVARMILETPRRREAKVAVGAGLNGKTTGSQQS